VSVLDPSYGKALTVGVLEPDYSQEFKRFLAYNDPELCSYVLSEVDLKKMPKLFKSDVITVQVAAGNYEGQSDWSILKVRLPRVGRASVSAPCKSSPSTAKRQGRASVGSSTKASPPSATRQGEDNEFDNLVGAKSGPVLESWLQHQKKDDIQAWLKKWCQQCSGSKEAMISRLITFKEANAF